MSKESKEYQECKRDNVEVEAIITTIIGEKVVKEHAQTKVYRVDD